MDAEDGRFVVWDRDAGVPLITAVASSCAVPLVYPPATIGGRRYVDGGIRSGTNADLAQGYPLVVILAPMAGIAVARGTLTAEIAALQAEGSRVVALWPDADAIRPTMNTKRGAASRRRPLAHIRHRAREPLSRDSRPTTTLRPPARIASRPS